ncbi:MAG: dihydropyrimidinase [Planctomycetes bacterium]|nr:dihydropyrimidinase [Planctomycetota bacterium]
MSLLIKNGRVVTATDDYFADIYVDGETIVQIGKNLTVEADRTIDATGKMVFPGGIDSHTHFDLPFGGTSSNDDFRTGTIAAAHGGTTTCIDFAVQNKGESTIKGLDTWHKKADGVATIDYSFHMIVTDMPVERLPELEKLAEEGVTSYKLFMAYPGVLYVDDGTLYRAFRQAGDNGTRICMHAENGIVIDEIVREAIADGKMGPKYHALTRPTRMEAEGVHRAIAIAEVANVPLYIVHLSCSDALDEVKRARARGVDVMAETCPQYLVLDQTAYFQEGFEGAKYVMTPALREKWNQDVLWKGLEFGHLANIATDHCPFCMKGQKDLGKDDFRKIPNGAPGVENRMSLMYHYGVVEGRLSLNRFVELTSTAAAKTFGLFPKKGTIAIGSDADLVVFDPERKETVSVHNAFTHHMNVDYSTYEGFELQGWSEIVISRGRVICDQGKLVTEGGGQFIKRARHGELLR